MGQRNARPWVPVAFRRQPAARNWHLNIFQPHTRIVPRAARRARCPAGWWAGPGACSATTAARPARHPHPGLATSHRGPGAPPAFAPWPRPRRPGGLPVAPVRLPGRATTTTPQDVSRGGPRVAPVGAAPAAQEEGREAKHRPLESHPAGLLGPDPVVVAAAAAAATALAKGIPKKGPGPAGLRAIRHAAAAAALCQEGAAEVEAAATPGPAHGHR